MISFFQIFLCPFMSKILPQKLSKHENIEYRLFSFSKNTTCETKSPYYLGRDFTVPKTIIMIGLIEIWIRYNTSYHFRYGNLKTISVFITRGTGGTKGEGPVGPWHFVLLQKNSSTHAPRPPSFPFAVAGQP